MMTCSECGAPVAEANFCGNCGWVKFDFEIGTTRRGDLVALDRSAENPPALHVRRFCAALLVLALAACTFPIRTKYDVDPAADFTRYRSYAWVPQESPLPASGARHGGYVSPLDEQRIVRTVDAELAAKGYRRVGAIEEADLVVAFAIGVQEKTRVTRYPSSTIRGYGSYGYGDWYTNTETRVETHNEGTLSIEFYDRKTQQAVWVGWARKRLGRGDDSEEVIRRAIDAVLAEFPGR